MQSIKTANPPISKAKIASSQKPIRHAPIKTIQVQCNLSVDFINRIII